MAFGVFTLGVAPYQTTNNGQKPVRLHLFSSTDSLATITTAGYLNNNVSRQILAEMNVGDFLQCSSSGTNLALYISAIASNGVVTLASLSAALVSSITADSGSVSGSAISIKGGGVTGAGKTVLFSGSGTALTLGVTDASSNTIVGKFSGNASSSGTNNTGLGQSSLQFLTSGSRNTTIGLSAGNGITTGSDNTALGSSALTKSATNGNNTAVGASTLRLATGASNTGLGTGAGLNLVGGALNVLVGFQAGSAYTGAESGNIIIGGNGVLGESNVTRLGYAGGTTSQSSAFIDGITGSANNTNPCVLVDSLGRLYAQSDPTAVTQGTSIVTAVVVNNKSGIITTVSTTLTALTATSFTLTNSVITSGKAVNVFLMGYSGTLITNGVPYVFASAITAGSCTINLVNINALNALNGTVKIGFEVF